MENPKGVEKTGTDDIDEVESLISGLIGVGTTIEFKTWCAEYNDLPNIQDIFDGKQVKVPSSTDTIYALISSMVRYAKNNKDDLIREYENDTKAPAETLYLDEGSSIVITNYKKKKAPINLYIEDDCNVAITVQRKPILKY